MSVTFGVSFTHTGRRVPATAASVAPRINPGSWPMNAPMCCSGMPWGQETFNSTASAPAASTALARISQSPKSGDPMMLATTRRSGKAALTSAIWSTQWSRPLLRDQLEVGHAHDAVVVFPERETRAHVGGTLQADGLGDYTAPPRFECPFHHVGGAGRRSGSEKKRVGELNPGERGAEPLGHVTPRVVL